MLCKLIRKIIDYVIACLFRQSVDEVKDERRRHALFAATRRNVNAIIESNDSYNRVVFELARKHSDKSGRTKAMLMARDVGGEMQRSRDWQSGNGSGRQAGSGRLSDSGSGRQTDNSIMRQHSEKSSTRSRPCQSSRCGSRIESHSDIADGGAADVSSKVMHLHTHSFSLKNVHTETPSPAGSPHNYVLKAVHGDPRTSNISPPTGRGMSIRDRLTFLNEIPSCDNSRASSDSERSATLKKDANDQTPVLTPLRVSRTVVPFVGARRLSKLMVSVKIHPANPATHSPREPP